MKRTYMIFVLALITMLSCSPVQVEITSRGVMLKDETVIHYLEAGQGPALVLVHGLGASAESWRDSMRLLAKGYRVIALDLPGYGKSDKPRGDYSIPHYAAVIGEFIDALGVDRVALAGNSMGGWMAVLAALERPEKVSHLILVNSAGLQRGKYPPVNLNPGTKEEQKALMLALFADPSFVTPKAVDAQWEYRKEIRGTVNAMLEALKAGAQPLDDRLKDIKVPTLIIWGRKDALIPAEFAERFARGIPGSRLAMIEDAGHLPQIEKPHAFSRAVRGFVRTW